MTENDNKQPHTVGRQLASGVFYTSIAKYAGIVVTLVVSGVLARLFTPEEFGVVNIATVVIAFFAIFSDLGIGPAVIQHKNLDKRDLGGIFSLTLWSGAVMALLFFAASGLIASFYDDSAELRNTLRILSANLFFAAANIVPNGLILKEKRFRFAAVRSLSVQVVGGAAAIAAAYAGAGIYALTINPVFSSLMLFVINYRQNPLSVHLKPGKAAVGKVFSFSAYQFSFQLLNYFSRNLDKLLMGRYMSLSQLGYYDKSYRLMMLPLQNIAYVVSPVMHPIFSEMQNDLRKLAVPDAAKCPDELPPVQVGAAAATVAQNFVHCRCHDGGIGVPVHKGRLWHGGFHRLAAVDKHHGRLGCCTQVRQALPIRVQDLQAGKGLFLRAQLRVTQGGDGIQHGAVVAADGKLLPAYRHAGGQLPAAHCCSGASPAVLPW